MADSVTASANTTIRAAGERTTRFMGNLRAAPKRSSRIRMTAYLLVLLTLPASQLHATEATEVPPLGLFGNDEVLWVFQRKPDKTGTLHMHFSFWLQRDMEQGGFFRPHIPGLRGAISKAALRGSAMHAIYRDGAHWRYNAQVFSRLPTAKPLRVIERNIPGNVVPVVIGSDEKKSILYALVTVRQAKEIQRLKIEADALEELEASEDVVNNNDRQQQAAPPLELTTDYAIIRYENGMWHLDRNAPQDLALGAKVPALAGYDGEIHLIYDDPSAPNTFKYSKSKKASAAWSSPSMIAFDDPLACAILSPGDPIPCLIASLHKNNAIVISIYRFQGNAWSLSSVLSDKEGRVRHFAQPVAVSFFASDLAIATQDADHVVSVSRWSLDTGRPIDEPKTVHALQTTGLTGAESRFRILLQYGILGGILTVVFLRRRESVTLVASIKKDQQLAPFFHRVAAFLIDMSILFPIWGSFMYQQLFAIQDGRLAFERYAVGESISPNELLYWLTAIVGAIFGLYCIIFETISTATPGKRILGMTVVSDRGERGSFMAILIRNMVRPIEFYFPPVTLLVAVTPSRQRLGDLLARTVVVMPNDRAMDEDSNQDQDQDHDEQEPRFDEKA